MKDYSIAALQIDLQSGSITSEYLVTEYLHRIAAWDRKVHAVVSINPDAIKAAKDSDAARAKGVYQGALQGIPILIKDNIDTADAVPTTAGSLAMINNYAAKDAFVVARLRAAGAIILGKTNLSEWANFRGHRSVSGWSSFGGLTRNPHALNRSACGSSSGSAVAVAAHFCVAAVGTETDGSIICPAQTNGVVGIKPTLGLVSRTGIIPIAPSQDTAGPMARTVRDAAIMLGVMAGVDPADSSTARSQGMSVDFETGLSIDGLKGVRLGIARQWSSGDPRLQQHLDDSIAVLEKAGAIIVDPVAVSSSDVFTDDELTLLHYEYRDALNRYLQGTPTDNAVHSLDELMAWNREHHTETMAYFGQEHLEQAAEKGDLTSEEYLLARAFAQQKAGREGIDAALAANRVDALVTLSGGPAWTIDMVLGDNHASDVDSTSAAAVSGYPHVTVPTGLVRGLPVGLSFIGTAWNDAALLRYAYAYEQRTLARANPTFMPSLEPYAGVFS